MRQAQGHLWHPQFWFMTLGILRSAWDDLKENPIWTVIGKVYYIGFTTLYHIPSGYVKIVIEHGHRNSGFAHWKWWFSSSLCKRLPEDSRTNSNLRDFAKLSIYQWPRATAASISTGLMCAWLASLGGNHDNTQSWQKLFLGWVPHNLANPIDHELSLSGKSSHAWFMAWDLPYYQLAFFVAIPNILAKLASSLKVGWRSLCRSLLILNTIALKWTPKINKFLDPTLGFLRVYFRGMGWLETITHETNWQKLSPKHLVGANNFGAVPLVTASAATKTYQPGLALLGKAYSTLVAVMEKSMRHFNMGAS